MKTKLRIASILLCVVLVAAAFAGCGGTDDSSLLLIGTTEFNGVFNYLFYNSAYDAKIVDLTSIGIYNVGRGDSMEDGACVYSVPEVKTDENGNVYTVYTFKLKEGLVFSDGTPITADDIIFSYKCQAAPAYEGLAALYTYNIRGINEYRYDDPNYADALERIKKDSENVTDEQLQTACREMAEADYSDESYGAEGLITDLGLEIDASLEVGSDAYKEAVIAAATAVYATDFKDYFIPDIIAANETRLTMEYVSNNMAGGEKVTEISGITKIDELTVQVIADGVDPTLEGSLAGVILPEHYYGKNITKVDFSEMKKLNNKPMGGGPYTFVSYKDNIVTMKANPKYYKGEPEIKTLKLQAVPPVDQIKAAIDGTVSVMEDVSCTPDNVAALEAAGKYPMIYPRNGWGYVGISAKKIPDINIRKGLSHLMNRDLGVKTAYGDLAEVLERPITKASWGYPENNSARVYEYSVDKALEYFNAAGYNKDDSGKLVDANGNQLKIDAYISSTDHPVVPLFTQMKVDMEAMGGILEIQQMDWASYSEMYGTGDLMLWAAAYGDGSSDPDCYQYFHSDSIAAGNNPYYLSDPDVDRLIMAGRSTLDRTVRQEIYDELFEKVMDTATVMPYYQRNELCAIDPTVVDLTTITQDPDPFYGFWASIDTTKLVETASAE